MNAKSTTTNATTVAATAAATASANNALHSHNTTKWFLDAAEKQKEKKKEK